MREGESLPTDECHYCHKKGHWTNVCHKLEADGKKDGGDSMHMTVGNVHNLDTWEVGCVYAMQGVLSNMLGVLVNCTATCHCQRSAISC
jgi:hypothetical protein